MPDGKAPHFPQQPVARQNDDGSLELECFLEAQPVPDIKWFYDTVWRLLGKKKKIIFFVILDRAQAKRQIFIPVGQSR